MKTAPKRYFYTTFITFRSYFYAFYSSFVILLLFAHKDAVVWGEGGGRNWGERGQQRRCRRAKLRRSAAVIKRHVPLTSPFQ